MQLLVQRSQRAPQKLFGSGPPLFTSYIRAEYTEEERANINKYQLGGDVVYSSRAAQERLARAGQHLETGGMGILKGLGALALSKMDLTITIASLQKGHHIECKDLVELLDAEETIISVCKEVSGHLKAAETFDGREFLVDLEQGN